MKKLINILILILFLCAPVSAGVERQIQDQYSMDKWAHFFAGAWLFDTLKDNGVSPIEAGAIVFFMSSAKEINDRATTGIYDDADIAAAMVGCVFTFSIDEIILGMRKGKSCE